MTYLWGKGIAGGIDMDGQPEGLEGSSEEKNIASEVMDNLGEPQEAAESVVSDAVDSPPKEENELPSQFKERIGRERKKWQKEVRRLERQIDGLMRQGSPKDAVDNSQYMNQPQSGEHDMIQQAVEMALRARDAKERQAQEAERMAHVHKSYEALQDHLDNASGNYDDFEDIVRSPNAPYTDTMRDTALLLPNAAEVLYKLGKDPENLKRISKLHPLDQAKEMVKLSHALTSGGNQARPQSAKPLSPIKSNPVTNSLGITEKTPVSEIRRQMRDGGWKRK